MLRHPLSKFRFTNAFTRMNHTPKDKTEVRQGTKIFAKLEQLLSGKFLPKINT